jgi:hypothetical protein
MHKQSTQRSPWLLVVAATALVVAAGPAAASTVYTEDWEKGTGTWVVTGTGTAAQDCTTAHTGSCSLVLTPACCSSSENAQTPFSDPLSSDTTTVSFFFEGSSTTGDTDVQFSVGLNTGDRFDLTLTEGCCPTNNGVDLRLNGAGQPVFASWGSAGTWYEGRIVFNPVAGSVHGELYDASGSLIGSGGNVALPSGATSITSLLISGIYWGGSLDSFHFDTISVWNGAPTPPPAQPVASLPAESANESVPGTSTPATPSVPVSTPNETAPATCTLSPCTTPTTIPGQTIPATNVTTQPVTVPKTCDPTNVVCVQSFTIPGQYIPLTPPIVVPGANVSPICQAAAAACLPATTIPGQTIVTVPGEGPIPLTPPISVGASFAGLDAYLTPNGDLQPFGPFNVTVPVPGVGPVTVTLCGPGSPCVSPTPPSYELDSNVTVTVGVGPDTYTVTEPVHETN